MKHLELFSGTHSFGKVSSNFGFDVISLDKDLEADCPFGTGYVSKNHIKEDIMTWNYKIYPPNYFTLITASPVCLWWSKCRFSWINRKLKVHGDKIITSEILNEDIEKYGVPMVDKVFEILDYFNPDYFLIENPQTGKMKEYINDLIPFIDVDYCQYGFSYQKKTRFWTNIKFKNTKCSHKIHNKDKDWNKGRITRYRIPEKLIENIIINMIKQKIELRNI
tara:strand:- start:1718 stop:2380 length:663 start_codon:yes stop_codon:yes gene_type:complete